MDSIPFFEDFLHHFVTWSAQGVSARLILMVGSQARSDHPSDAHSDLDLEVFGTDYDPAAYLSWLRSFAPVWMILDDPGSDVPKWLVLYQGGFKVDVSLNSMESLNDIIRTQRLWSSQQRGYAVLLDKEHLAPLLPAIASDPSVFSQLPDESAFRKLIDQYWYGSLYVARQIKRGNLWKVKWADQLQQNTLLTMLEWHALALHDGNVSVWNNGNFMREWVDEPTWYALHDVFAHFDAEDSWRALHASMQLFQTLSEAVAVQLHFEYPATMVQDILTTIERL